MRVVAAQTNPVYPAQFLAGGCLSMTFAALGEILPNPDCSVKLAFGAADRSRGAPALQILHRQPIRIAKSASQNRETSRCVSVADH
jgi:hypothetical protein